VPYLVVALTGVDTVDDPALLELIELEIRELLSANGFPGDTLPVVRVSALDALQGEPEGIRSVLDLMDALDTCVALPQREVDQPFLMPIEDVLSISGRGTVVTGRVERGRVKVGEEIEIVGFGPSKKDVVIGVSMSRTLSESAEAGDHIGVLLRDTSEAEVARGQVLSKAGSITPRTRFKGEVYVLPKVEGGRDRPFFNHYRLHFSIRTAQVTGSVTLPEGVAMLMPGDIGAIVIELGTAVALENGMRFAIREEYRLIADGIVTDCGDWRVDSP
jgi:elongation factor Tu